MQLAKKFPHAKTLVVMSLVICASSCRRSGGRLANPVTLIGPYFDQTRYEVSTGSYPLIHFHSLGDGPQSTQIISHHT